MEIVDRTPRPPLGFPQRIMWACPVVEAVDVSNHVLEELFVYSREQQHVVVAYVNKKARPPNISVATVVQSVLGDWRAANISCSDNNDGMFFVKLSSAADVEKFYGHGWMWFQEHITFCRVLCLTETAKLTANATVAAKAPQQWF